MPGQGLVAVVPGVAKRVVAVADMHGAGVAEHRVGPRRGARDDEVVLAEVKGLDRRRVQRQQRAEGPGRGSQGLQERSVHGAGGEAPLGPLLVVHRGVDRRVGPHLAQLSEHALGPAQIEQEVVHERHPGRRGRALGLTDHGSSLSGQGAQQVASPDRAIRLDADADRTAPARPCRPSSTSATRGSTAVPSASCSTAPPAWAARRCSPARAGPLARPGRGRRTARPRPP